MISITFRLPLWRRTNSDDDHTACASCAVPMSDRSVARCGRRPLDDLDHARPRAAWAAQIPRFGALLDRDQPQHVIAATEAPRGGWDRRAPLLRATSTARRIRSDRGWQRAASGAEGIVRMGPAPY